MKLSDWLKENGVLRKDFAARIDVSPSYITAMCDGSVWPGRGVLESVVEATDGKVQPNDFLAGPKEKATPEEGAAA